ncbi:TonB-dependent receptor domain-containing protein [Anditalea andensis]|uniref:TonB-dependent receptor n=1 Tax=Anditalea andensis TaxID=1048983 RepID=A0A074LIV9_9BACT|nr:outer membrane beta-barrel family protein [Anditalea andensis]KEO73727.1 TonB-dependent receptor [Anditalea andensis]
MKSYLGLFISFFLFFLSVDTVAQNVRLKGRVVDRDTGDPLEFANIALLSPRDSALVTGGTAELDGNFSFTAVAGEYIVRAGFIGYEQGYKNVTIGDKAEINLGRFRLVSTAEALDEVVVEGVTSMFESDIDKRSYNVENSIVAEGATASELLGTLPSIQMDDEGGITMRGSGNILIYINGRPSNLSGDDAESILAQFPASSIKSVELITNPSSRYDASGVGGIINIILKKDQRLGVNGQANVSVGTRDKYNAGININYGGEKINYFGSYNYQDRTLFRESEALRSTNIPGASPFLDQDGYGENRDRNHFMRAGFDYTPSENSTFSFYGQANVRERSGFNELNQRSQNAARQLDSLYVRNENDHRSSFNIETGLSFTHDFDTLGQQVFTSLSYSRDERDQTELFDQLFYNSFMEEVPQNFLSQTNIRPQVSDLYIYQLDYIKPFQGGGNLEAGLKGTFGVWDRGQEFFQADEDSNFQPIRNDTISDNFTFREDVYAAYTAYRNRTGKLGYQVGLRGEYTETIGYQTNTDQEFINNYFNLFPSAYINYNLAGPEEELRVNYSRRISRPNIWGLAPFYRVSDLLNIGIGNPNLQPELTDSYELGYQNSWGNYLFTGTVYHRYSTNVQTRVIALLDNNVAVQTRENAASRSNTGLELINQFEFTNWWDMMISADLFYSEIRGENIEAGFTNSNFSWTLNLISNINIPNFASIQIQGDYRGPIVLPQGEIEPLYGLNIGAKKNILNDRATISLNVSDVFNTRVFRITTEDARFDQRRVFNRETRIGTLTFTYRFGGFRDRSERERDSDYDEESEF